MPPFPTGLLPWRDLWIGAPAALTRFGGWGREPVGTSKRAALDALRRLELTDHQWENLAVFAGLLPMLEQSSWALKIISECLSKPRDEQEQGRSR